MRRMTITGNLCADPRIGETPSGTKVANLRVAANEREKNTDTGEYENKAEFFDVDIWRGVDAIAEYFHKSSGIVLDGDFGTRDWIDRDGNARKNLCLHNASWEFPPKSDGAGGGGADLAPAAQQQRQAAPAQQQAPMSDDDIPF